MGLADGTAWEKEHGYTKPKKEKPNHCCVCTSKVKLEPYMRTKWRCYICVKEGRHPAKSS